jgi:hypothetical protein
MWENVKTRVICSYMHPTRRGIKNFKNPEVNTPHVIVTWK